MQSVNINLRKKMEIRKKKLGPDVYTEQNYLFCKLLYINNRAVIFDSCPGRTECEQSFPLGRMNFRWILSAGEKGK